MKKGFTSLLGSTALVAGLVGTPPAWAQSAQLEEIVVTAQKRSENLQRVPVSIAAFTPSKLEEMQLESASQLQAAVPGLVYTSSGGFATPFIRGIGTDSATVGAEAGVATYVDGVYVSNPLSVNMDLIDIERIEVVKGPQGTLYGRNAIGGAINVITREPGQKFEGKLTAGYGNHERLDLAAFASGPISDKLAVGVYVNYLNRESFLKNLVAVEPAGVPDRRRMVSLRGKMVFTPSETVRFVLTGEYQKNDSPDLWGFRQVQDNALGLLAGGRTSTRPRHVYHNFPSYQTSRLYAGTLRGEVEFDFAKLVSITGYRNFRSNASIDYDGTDAQIIGFGILPAYSRQWSQEVQLVSLPSNPVKWIVGAYYFDEKTGGRFDLAPGDIVVELDSDLPVRSYAAFAEVTVPVGEKLSVTGGLRYTKDKKEISPAGLPPTQKTSFEKATWRGSLTYQFTPDAMSYFTYSRGFQSGAFNAVDFGAAPVNPETLDAFELGLKSSFLDRRVQLNLAAFYYNFKDLQVQTNDSVGGAAASFQNAGKARVKGFEANLNAIVVDGFQVDASVSYLHSRYLNFTNYAGFVRDPAGGNAAIPVNVTGNSAIRTPKWTASLGGTYTANLGSAGKIELAASYYYNDGYAFDPQHLVNQKSYDLVNGSISWLPTENIRASLWAQNLTNTNYLVFGVASNYGTTHADAPGRQYGLRLSYTF